MALDQEVVPCDGLRCVHVLVKQGKLKSLSFAEKRDIISAPKPTPDLCISQSSQRHKRKFSRAVYKTHWIVGCSHTNKMYCWCCIFFSNDINVWNSSGYEDLNNLSGAIKRHTNSGKHLSAVIAFSNFGKLRIEAPLSRQLSEDISKHNMRVDNNRSVFQRLVDIVCHLAQQELPFKGNDESNTSLNRGNVLELVSLLSKYDCVLEKHVQSDQPSSSYLSYKIQNDIIQSVADVIRARIENEVKKTKFVSVIIEETPDVSHREQLCLILRYFGENDIHDRFMRYVNVSLSRTADVISNIILELLKKHDCTEKLVAQSYDGASVMSGIRNEVQQKVKEVCPEATYIWCDAHDLALVLSKSCYRISEISSFFSALQSISIFFSRSTKRAAFYDTHCSKKMPNAPATRWTCMSQLVNTVFDQKDNLVTVFSEICDHPEDWDGDTILAAGNFETLMNSFNFNFFLNTFHHIFEKSDSLYNIVQKSEVNVYYCSNKIKEFQTWLRVDFQSEFGQIYDNTLQNHAAPRMRRNISCAQTEYKRLFVEIIDKIHSEVEERYSEIIKLKFFQLVNNKKFENYNSNFPSEALDSLFETYPNFFDRQTLKNQLACLYSSDVLRNCNVFELIDFINQNNLEEAFPQLLKLANLVVTIPATSASAERAFSSLKRIHTYLRNTQGQERVSDLSTIAIEKQLLVDLKRSPTFYCDVIDCFLKKDRRFELVYK
ncbi:zinc finger MYM-type protein 1-like [Cydia fagiglandana]|uniref:zinc finger MYM-type protein 1-like n=1 Tax=Cydia fagiglandana TaxID=1458189 RepID=UPI002FEDF0A1